MRESDATVLACIECALKRVAFVIVCASTTTQRPPPAAAHAWQCRPFTFYCKPLDVKLPLASELGMCRQALPACRSRQSRAMIY